MEKALRKRYFNLCNPYKPQSLESGLVLDIDKYEINGQKIKVRGKVWADEIAEQISWNDEPQALYFTGYPGSGKTTELHRTIKVLEQEDDANLLAVYINAIDFFDIHDKIELVDVLSVIVYNTSLAVARYQNKDEEEAFSQGGFFTRLWTWLNDTDVTLESLEVDQAPFKLIFEMKNRRDFRKKVKENVSTNITTFKRDVNRELQRLNEIVQHYEIAGKRKSGIVVVLDTLEKNRGIGKDIDLIAETSERLFRDKESLTLPIDVIYTVPAYLSTRHINDIFFLPVARVMTEQDEPYDDGIEVMEALIYDRIPKEHIDEIFAESSGLLHKIILFSGGYPRDLLKMLQKVIMVDDFPVSVSEVDTIFMDLENEYQEFVPMEFKEKLLEIHASKKLDLSENEQRRIAYELFNIHAILRYRNGHLWWALHPALQKVLEIKQDHG